MGSERRLTTWLSVSSSSASSGFLELKFKEIKKGRRCQTNQRTLNQQAPLSQTNRTDCGSQHPNHSFLQIRARSGREASLTYGDWPSYTETTTEEYIHEKTVQDFQDEIQQEILIRVPPNSHIFLSYDLFKYKINELHFGKMLFYNML